MSDTQSYFDNAIGTSFWSLNSNGVQLLRGTYISLLRVKNRFLLSQTGLCIHHACIFLLLHHMSLTTFMSASLDFCTMPDTQSSFLWICFTSFMFVSFGSCTVSSTIPFLLGYGLVHLSWPHIFTFAPCLTLYSSFLCMVGTALAFACFTTRCLMVIFSSFSTADTLLCLVEIVEVR